MKKQGTFFGSCRFKKQYSAIEVIERIKTLQIKCLSYKCIYCGFYHLSRKENCIKFLDNIHKEVIGVI